MDAVMEPCLVALQHAGIVANFIHARRTRSLYQEIADDCREGGREGGEGREGGRKGREGGEEGREGGEEGGILR
jgi:predicted transposase YdaD